ncbi:MAG: dihydrofolate reductase [Megasphaera sp.]|jgi:dihydrofolate reductase|nr:dihydrofolate reductase [Megasphaera sp.]MCH4187314.1 dihydrofolate reductase [Megasphaera sp.]MCH4217280.1 dihydrofolate reductase [Megasphaera sp.]
MIHIIAAVDAAGGIGKDNDLLCHLPADLKRFKSLTMGHPIVMGRKTFESLPGILPGRQHVVLTRQRSYEHGKDVVICHDIDEVIQKMKGYSDYFVIGGASLYELFLPKADMLHLTEIKATFPADTFFPKLEPGQWKEMKREHHLRDEKNKISFDFVTYIQSKSADRGQL